MTRLTISNRQKGFIIEAMEDYSVVVEMLKQPYCFWIEITNNEGKRISLNSRTVMLVEQTEEDGK